MKCSIRPYKERDFERLCHIHDAARMDELRLGKFEDAFVPLVVAAENEGLFDYQIDVAEIKGEVVGFVAFTSSELGWLYVDPKVYRYGIATELSRHVIKILKSDIYLEVLTGNEPACQLYKKIGFKLVKQVSGKMVGNEAFHITVDVMEYKAAPT